MPVHCTLHRWCLMLIIAFVVTEPAWSQIRLRNFKTTNGNSTLGSLYSGVTLGNSFYFRAGPGDEGYQLWKTDGTLAGTTIPRTVGVSSLEDSDPYLKAANGQVFYLATTSTYGKELWRSDGTEVGTYLVEDIFPGTQSAFVDYDYGGYLPFKAQIANGVIVFSAYDGVHGKEPWRSDGTTAGTYLLKDIKTGTASSGVSFTELNSVQIGNLVYFTANDDTGGRRLYRTDGTSAGTYQLIPESVGSLYNVNGTLFFYKNIGPSNSEIWKSDGTYAGTTFVTNLGLGSGFAGSSELIMGNNNQVFYYSRDLSQDQRQVNLYKTDGTPSGTQLLKADLWGIHEFMALNGGVAFWNNGESSINNDRFLLWHSDGTVSGTKVFQEHVQSPGDAAPWEIFKVNDRLIYVWRMPGIGLHTWISNGTTAGTRQLKNYVVEDPSFWTHQVDYINNQYVLLARGELWGSDGTSDGTVQLSQFTTLFGTDVYPSEFTACNGGILVKGGQDELFFHSGFSLKNGNWNDSSIWWGNRIPTVADPVQISTGHTVTVNVNNATCKGVTLLGNLQYLPGGQLTFVP